MDIFLCSQRTGAFKNAATCQMDPSTVGRFNLRLAKRIEEDLPLLRLPDPLDFGDDEETGKKEQDLNDNEEVSSALERRPARTVAEKLAWESDAMPPATGDKYIFNITGASFLINFSTAGFVEFLYFCANSFKK